MAGNAYQTPDVKSPQSSYVTFSTISISLNINQLDHGSSFIYMSSPLSDTSFSRTNPDIPVNLAYRGPTQTQKGRG